MRIGICLSPENAATWPAFPADYLEVNVQIQLRPESDDPTFAVIRSDLHALPCPILAANCFIPGDLRIVGPEIDNARLMRYARTAFARAEAVGIRHIAFGSAVARRVPEGWSHAVALDQFVAALRLIGPVAADHNLTLAVEPLTHTECNLLNTVIEGAIIVGRADHPNVRLLADLYHMLLNGESADDLREVAPLLTHVHLAEFAERRPPGAAGDNFRPFFRALVDSGYSGHASIECHWGADPRAEAGRAVAELRRQFADVAHPIRLDATLARLS